MPNTLNTLDNLTTNGLPPADPPSPNFGAVINTTSSGPVTVIPTPVVVTPKILCICIGGLGGSQLVNIQDSLSDIPGVHVCVLSGQNEYQDAKREVWQYMNAAPDTPTVFIGHSMGGMTAVDEANAAILDNRPVAGVVVLDLVQYETMGLVTCDCPNVLAFKADNSAPFGPTQIEGHPWQVVQVTPKFLQLKHNLICHSPLVIQQISAFVRAAMGTDTKGQAL
jgi:hypothetical protein